MLQVLFPKKSYRETYKLLPPVSLISIVSKLFSIGQIMSDYVHKAAINTSHHKRQLMALFWPVNET